jgi:hypothetical protein
MAGPGDGAGTAGDAAGNGNITDVTFGFRIEASLKPLVPFIFRNRICKPVARDISSCVV